jgi:starch-binding outer membrane protein, SusD/RagB family
MKSSKTGAGRTGRATLARLSVGVLALTVAACNTDKLVDLTNPDLVTGDVARNTANLNELRNGAQYEFARALTGPPGNNGTPGIIGISGLLTDELWYSSTFTGMQEIDRRSIKTDNTNLLPVYQYLHRARNLSEQAAAAFDAVPERKNTEDQAMLTNYAGYSYLFFAETFCSGVPFSTTDLNGAVVLGPGITTAAMLDSAINRFNTAMTRATAAGSSDQQNLARIGLGRALLAKGDYAGAAAAVSAVPTDFVYTVEYSPNTSGQYNGIYQNIAAEHRSSAATNEGANGLTFFNRGPAGTNTIDPRVDVDSIAVGTNVLKSPVYRPNKYADLDSPVVLASGTEARLIQAEAALSKGTSGAYLTTLNALRADAGMTPLVDPITAAARNRQFFSERAFWLYLTGHRLGDLRRMVRDYGFAQSDVFPVGQTIFNGSYGTDVNFPVPLQEENNPQFANGTCIDRNP